MIIIIVSLNVKNWKTSMRSIFHYLLVGSMRFQKRRSNVITLASPINKLSPIFWTTKHRDNLQNEHINVCVHNYHHHHHIGVHLIIRKTGKPHHSYQKSAANRFAKVSIYNHTSVFFTFNPCIQYLAVNPSFHNAI